MKKLFSILLGIAIFVSVSTLSSAGAATTTTTTVTNWDSAASLNRVNTIGTKLLTAGSLPQGITFKVSDSEDVNAYANINKEVYVYRGLLQYVTSDEELAAVISHELGHIINGHCAKQTLANSVISNFANSITTEQNATAIALGQQLSTSKLSRADEFDADLSGVDLLVKAGYNPLAMISVLNKICGNYFDIVSSHPSGEKRLMNIYDYVAYNYPTQLKKNYTSDSYKKAYVLINATLEERNANPKKVAKAKKQQEKLKAKKLKRAKKMVNSLNPWDASYNALLLLNSGN